MDKPVIAQKSPVKVTLEAGVAVAWCACGRSKTQPFCDGSHQPTGFTPIVFKVDNSGEYYLCQCKQSKNKPYCDGSHRNL